MSLQLRHHYPAGASIFREGDAGDCAYVVETGEVEIRREIDGRTVLLAARGPGELFGEMALIDGKPRSAGAVATADSELSLISRDQLNAYLERAEPVMQMLLEMILARFRNTLGMLSADSAAALHEPAPAGEAEAQAARRFAPAVDAIKLAQEIDRGIAGGQFELHYQPQLSMHDGSVYGFESLIRWRHPERGLISPAHFVPVAEQTGLIVALGRWILEDACRAQRRLHGALAGVAGAPAAPAISVNVSGRELAEPGFVAGIRDAVLAPGIDPALLTLEITESLLMERPDVARATLEQCRDLGLRIAIDDFGTGYSSLNYLHRFPIDVLKIDQSFVAAMLDDTRSREVVAAIVALARALRMRVVAEGIELDPQLAALRALGCDYAQGYLHSKPLPLDGACAFLEDRHARAASAPR